MEEFEKAMQACFETMLNDSQIELVEVMPAHLTVNKGHQTG
jgi:hypothetical protein